jgi:peptidoglycan/LPS O-acetylase OafA/YrhL
MLRPLRHAMVIFMGVAVVAWVASLILLRQGAAETLEQAMWPVAAVAVALVAGLEAFYLWTRRNDEAFRLGMWGAALALLALAVAALYLHSYFAVALLGLPAYLMVLLLQGRRGDGSLQRHRAKKRGAPLAVENHGR